MTTDLAIRFTQKDGKVIATLISADADGIAISVEKADPQTAAAELVKAYFTLNPLDTPAAKLPPHNRTAYSEYGIQHLLHAAVDQDLKVEIDYRDAEGVASKRLIEPRSVDAARRLVVAWDIGKQSTRSFRLDRITCAQVL